MRIYEIDGFELNLDNYHLLRGGEPIDIGPKPFDLLLYLIRNKDRTVSKDELIREVWKAQAVSDSTVPTCIAAVRTALADDSQDPKFIQTVRGRGYRFIGNALLREDGIPDSQFGEPQTPASGLFVGRQSEMVALSAALANVLCGHPTTFLLLGEAGIGKTRMLDEFSHHAKSRGASVLIGRCREEAGAPAFWPWVQILRTHIESADRRIIAILRPYAAVISQMLPEIRRLFPQITPPQEVEAEQARFRLLDAITRFLQASTKQAPLLLMIDDLHRADISSLLLLEFLVRELNSSPVMIIAAYRDLDIRGDIVREQCLARVARAAASRSIQLTGISRSAVGELIGQPEETAIVERLYEQTAGNPFFLTQLVQLLAIGSSSNARQSPNDWRFSLPAGVIDAISAQLSVLPLDTRRILTVAATIGRDFSAALLTRACGATHAELLERLEPARAARLIENTRNASGSYRFCHALLRDLVYNRIPALNRSILHKQIGEALEALYVSDLDSCTAELAFHFSEGATTGDAAKAITYCIAAGEQATSRLAHENAPEYFRSAIRLMGNLDVADPRKRCEILIKLGAAEIRAGERNAARESLLHAANIARQIDAPELLARAALGLAPGFFTIEVGTYDPELGELLEEAQRALSASEIELHVQLAARLALDAVWSDAPSRCDAISASALALAESIDDPATKAYALSARHGALWGPEQFGQRCELIAEIGELSDEASDAEIALMYRVLNITALLEAGRIEAVDREIISYNKLANDLQLPHAQWYVSLFHAMRLLMQGKFREAESVSQEFLDLGNRVQDRNAPQSFGAQLILRRWEENRLGEVIPALNVLISSNPKIDAWKCVLAFCLSELGDPDGLPVYQSLAERGFEKTPRNETWAIAMSMLSIAALNHHDLDGAKLLYNLSLPAKLHFTIVGYGVLSFGSRARELGNLASLMECFDEAAEHFELAIAQNRKTGQAPWVARSQYDYARMLAGRRDRGRRGQIRELVTEARKTANRLGMVRLKLQIADLMKEV